MRWRNRRRMRRGRRRTLEKEDGRMNKRNARQPQSERCGIETDGDDRFLAIGDDDGEFDHAHTKCIGMRPHRDETHPGPYLVELLAVPQRLVADVDGALSFLFQSSSFWALRLTSSFWAFFFRR